MENNPLTVPNPPPRAHLQSRGEGRLVIDFLLDEADDDQGTSAKPSGKEIALETAGMFFVCRDHPPLVLGDAPDHAAKPFANALARLLRDGSSENRHRTRLHSSAA